MLLSLERHVVEHVEQDLFGCPLYELGLHLELPAGLHALRYVYVGREAVILKPECLQVMLLLILWHGVKHGRDSTIRPYQPRAHLLSGLHWK
jgi:hypothetical protein